MFVMCTALNNPVMSSGRHMVPSWWSLSLYLLRVAGPGTAVSAWSIQTLSDRAKTPLPAVDLWPPGRPRADRQPTGPRSRAGQETEEVCLVYI